MLINGLRWNHGCSPHPFFEGASMRVLLHGNTWGFFHPWTILASLLLKNLAQHQLKAKRSCNCIMTFCQYFFRKFNMQLQTRWWWWLTLVECGRRGGCTYMYQLSWATRSHRTTDVAGSLLTLEMQEEFTAHAWLLACKLPTWLPVAVLPTLMLSVSWMK
jgi:hypothetical protein